MKSFKNILVALPFLFAVFSLQAQKPLEIRGKIHNNTFEKVELKKAYNNEETVIATTSVGPDGTFLLKAVIAQPDLFRMSFTEKEYLLSSFSPGEKVNLEIDAKDLSKIKAVSGSASMIFVKEITDRLPKNKTLLDSLNAALQNDRKQLYYNGFYQNFSPFQQTNKDIDNYVVEIFESHKKLEDMAEKFGKKGKVVPQKTDSLLLLAPPLLKKIHESYTVFKNYQEHIRPNYDFSSERNPEYSSFQEKTDQYMTLLDERHGLLAREIAPFAQEAGRIVEKKDNMTYNGSLDNKKERTSMANEILDVIERNFEAVTGMEADYRIKAQASENLSKEIFTDAQNEVSSVVSEYQKTYESESQKLNQELKELLTENKEDLAVMMFMDYFPKEKNKELHTEIIEALRAKYPENQAVQERYKILTSAAFSTSVGSMAPELAFPNPEGDILKLSDLRGKYVLIDFWASWCGPCRRENPHVVSLYNKYKDKGFDIYSVSLDRDKNGWLKAIEADKLTWPNHVSDLKYWSSEAAKIYGVNSIPATFLLDQEGRIIGKNLRGNELTNTLRNIFGE